MNISLQIKNIFFTTLVVAFLTVCIPTALAQNLSQEATSSSETSRTSSSTANRISSSTVQMITDRTPISDAKDITKPEELSEKVAIVTMFEARPVESPSFFSFMAYWVQQAVLLGVPANTIVLILLAPIIATMVAFMRVVVGLPTLELFVPIALAFAFVAVGLVLGLIILTSVLLASYVSRAVLRKMSIMFFPKRSLSMLFLSIFVFAGLTVAIVLDVGSVRNLSIFPVLILMLLGDSIVSVQLYKSVQETTSITIVTLVLGILGYALAMSPMVQHSLILYPEIVFLTIPVNILIGRYFGLRLVEFLRFNRVA